MLFFDASSCTCTHVGTNQTQARLFSMQSAPVSPSPYLLIKLCGDVSQKIASLRKMPICYRSRSTMANSKFVNG
jgi:hypothetical protein